MRASADVAVLGCGPAGAAAAIRCAQAGLDTILIEAETFPRDRPGETLHPGVEPLLEMLGVLDDVLQLEPLRHTGNWIEWGGEREFQAFGADEDGQWRGFQVLRSDLDAILMRRARQVGVAVYEGCRASSALIDADRLLGVSTAAGDVRAQWVVDAGGGRHWLADQLGIDTDVRSPRLLAWYGYAEGSTDEWDAPRIAADEGGWTWIAPIRAGLLQWTRLNFDNARPEPTWLPPQLAGYRPRGTMRGADVTWRAVAPPAGPGFFMIGDAAAVLDPASSHGVLKGLVTGIKVSHLIEQARSGAIPAAKAAADYAEFVRRMFDDDVAKLRQIYQRLPNSPFGLHPPAGRVK